MRVEQKSLIYSMINNLVISTIKVLGGIFFHLSSLFADGIHTFADFITDIFALIGAKMSKKRPTKTHPFGFGRIEYITNLLIGIVIILLGIFILVMSFTKKPVIPEMTIIILLLVVSVLKIIAIQILKRNGEKINSGILLTAAKESETDLYSSLGVILIVILMQFSDKVPYLEYADLIGSILIALIVIKTAIPIIKQNIMNLIGEIDLDANHLQSINNIISTHKQINGYEAELIKYGNYYKVHLTLELDSKITLRQINNLEKKLVKELKKNKEVKTKHINIDVVPHLKK